MQYAASLFFPLWHLPIFNLWDVLLNPVSLWPCFCQFGYLGWYLLRLLPLQEAQFWNLFYMAVNNSSLGVIFSCWDGLFWTAVCTKLFSLGDALGKKHWAKQTQPICSLLVQNVFGFPHWYGVGMEWNILNMLGSAHTCCATFLQAWAERREQWELWAFPKRHGEWKIEYLSAFYSIKESKSV